MRVVIEKVKTPTQQVVKKHFLSNVSIVRAVMVGLLITSDTAALFLSTYFPIRIRAPMGHYFVVDLYEGVYPFLVIFIVFYASRGLYRTISVTPFEELRRIITSTSTVFLVLATILFLYQQGREYSRMVFGLSWFFAIVLVPLFRTILRSILIYFGIWGEPVAVVGYGEQSLHLIDIMQKNARMGMRPVVVYDMKGGDCSAYKEIPVIQAEIEDLALISLFKPAVETYILVAHEIPSHVLDRILRDFNQFGSMRKILITDLDMVSSVGVIPHDLMGIVGLEIPQKLVNYIQQHIKRVLDVILATIVLILSSPLLLMIILSIWIDSPGSSFYGQERIGKDGKKFKMWKFRTMMKNADAVLKQFLEEAPALRAEWEATRKLKKDPRITRVGALLRRLSLDELPQLFNVISGEMSLIGPRPIVNSEISYYGESYKLYCMVFPGITGMWQVSGRSDTTYTERVRLDEYYVRNWSIWLDLYILICTFRVLIRREGAY